MDIKKWLESSEQTGKQIKNQTFNFNPTRDELLKDYVQTIGTERISQMYDEWAKQLDSATEGAKGIQKEYSAKDNLANTSNQLNRLVSDGSFFNKVGQMIGYGDVSKSLEDIKTSAKSLGDLASFYSQWDTEEKYTNAMNEKTDREKNDEKYIGKGYKEKYSGYEFASQLESLLQQQYDLRGQVFADNGTTESELTDEDVARYINVASGTQKNDNAFTTPGYENQNSNRYEGLVSQEEFEYMQGLYNALISERKDRYALRKQEAELRAQEEANAQVIQLIHKNGDIILNASDKKLITDYKDPKSDESLKNQIRERLKSKGYTSAQINDIVEYAEGERNKEKISIMMEELEGSGWFAKTVAFISNNSFGNVIKGSLAAITDTIGELFSSEMFTGEYGSGYNHAYAGGNYLNQLINAKNQTISQSIDNTAVRSVVDFTASTIQAGTTILVSAAAAHAIFYASGGTASGIVLKDLVSGIGSALFGVTSAGSTMTDVVSRGGTAQQALTLGVLSGAIETATEKLPLDNLVDIFTKTDATKGFLRTAFSSALKQMPAEAGEEFVSQMAGYITDLGVMGWDESQIGELWRNNVSSGLSESNAAAQTFLDIIGASTYAGLGGAFSGFLLGGSSSSLSQTISHIGLRNTGKQLVKSNMAEPLLEYASSITVSDENAQKQLTSILSQEKQSKADIGRVFNILSTNAVHNLQAQVNSLNEDSQSTELTKAVTKGLLGSSLTATEMSLVSTDTGMKLVQQVIQSQAYADANKVFSFVKESNTNQTDETADTPTTEATSVQSESVQPSSEQSGTAENVTASVSGSPASAPMQSENVSGTDATNTEPYVPQSRVDENGKLKTVVVDGVEVDVETWQPVINEPNLTDTSGANTSLATDKDGEAFMRTDEHIRVENMAEKLGMQLEWSSKIGGEGLYSKGIIYLNPHCEYPKLMVLKHEFTHYLENSPWYNSFVKYLKSTQVYQDWINDNHNGEAAYTEELENSYDAAGLPFDVTHEIVANFVAERVLGGKGGFVRDAYGRNVSNDSAIVKALTEFAETHTHWYDAILTHIKDVAAKLKDLYYSVREKYESFRNKSKGIDNTHKEAKQQSESQELDEIYRRLVQLKATINTKKAAQADGQYSVQEIFDENGKSYGIGVVLDSQKLNDLSEQERIDTVKEHIKNLGNVPFVAFDSNGNKVQIKIAPKTKYKNQKGNDAHANRHLTKFLFNEIKQETLMQIDEVIHTATFNKTEPANHPHGWLDNNGQNDWDVWTTYIQDKEKTIWKAKLKVANSSNGEKILYAVYPIEKVEQVRKETTSTTKSRISQPDPNVNKNSSANTDYATDNNTTPTDEGQAYVSTSRHNDLHQQYKSGKITLEEYQAEMDARDKAQATENRKLRQQKKNLQDARQQLQERFKNEHGGWSEPKSLEVLRAILKEYPTKVAATKILPAYFKLLTFIQNHPNATMEELEAKAIDLIANPILDSMKTLKSEEGQALLADIKQMRFRLSDEQLAEIKYIYGRVQHWRHSVQGKVRITDDADAMTLDQAWKEMSELYPDKFDPEANALDMPALLDDIITQASEEISVFEIVPRETMAREIALRAIGGYHQVPKVLMRADQVQREINREREKNIKQSQRQKRSQLRQQIRSLYTDFKKRLFNGNDNVYVPEEFRQVVCDVLECLTYIVSDGNKESVTAKLKTLSGELANVKSEGSTFGREFMTEEFLEDAKHFSGYANAIANTIAGKSASELTLTEMQDIVNLCGDIKYALQHATAIIRDGKAESVAEAAYSLVRQQESVSEKESINGIDLETLNVMRIVLTMGEYDEDSVIVKLFRDIEQGYIKQLRYQVDCNKRFEDVIATDPQAYEKICNEVIEWKPVNSELKPVRMTKMQAMQILMTYDRERNGVTRHLEEGGVRIVDAELVLKGKYEKAKAKAQKLIVTEGVYNSIREQLFSSNDATFIKEYWDTAYELFNHYSRDAINEVSMQRQHRMIATTKNYIPMIVDGDYIEANLEGVSFNYSLANTGSLKSVERGADAPVMVEGLNFVVRRNIDTTAKIYGMLIPVENCKKVINQSTDTGVRVHGIIEQRWGNETYKVIEQVLTDVQTRRVKPQIENVSKLSRFFRWVARNFNLAVLADRVTTVVSQFSAYFSAGAYIEQRHLLKTLKDLPKNSMDYEKIEAEIDAHTPLHKERRDELIVPELRDVVSQDSFIKKTFDNLNDKKVLWVLNPYNLITRADRQITRLLWLACKDQVNAKTTKSEIGTDAYWKEVTNLYERVILDTQSTYSPLHRAEISKADSLKKYAFGFFKTEPLQHYGTMHDAYHKMIVAKRKGNTEMLKSARKQFVRTFVSQVEIALSYSILKFVAGVLTANLGKRWRDDDEELTGESISKELAKTGGEALLSSFLPMTSDIIFEFGETLIGILTGEGYEYYVGEVFEIPSFEQLNDLLKKFFASIQSTSDMIDEESDKTAEERTKDFLNGLRDLAEVVGNITGVPVENISTIFDGIYKHATAIAKGEDISYALDMGVERSNAIESHRMYEALLDGDTAKYNQIYNSLIAKGLTKAQIKNGVARIIADTNSKVTDAAEISRERDKLADDEQSKDKYNDLTTQLNTYILKISGEGEEEIPVDIVTKAIELKVNELDGERLSGDDKSKIESTAANLSDKYNDELQQSDYYKDATPLEQTAISSKVEKYANAVAKAEVDDEYKLSNDYTAIHILETEDDVSVVELLVLYETADIDDDGKVTVKEYARAVNESKQLSDKQKQFLISLKKAKNDEVRQRIWDNYRNN